MSKKKRKKNRTKARRPPARNRPGGVERPGGLRADESDPGGRPAAAADPVYDGADWERLRQGARNASGIRYQLAVTAYLLAAARAGQLPFAELTPEGYEDIDCVDGDGGQWFVQVKEVGAGAGTFTAGPFVDAVLHAHRIAPPDSRIVVVTDAALGSGLSATGFDTPVLAPGEAAPAAALSLLSDRGLERSEAQTLLARAHLVRLPWNLASVTVDLLCDGFGLVDAVASVVYAALIEDLSAATADQRATTPATRIRRTIGDLETVVTDTAEVVDQASLDEAVVLGIARPANYGSTSAVSRAAFLLGIDADPSHIGSDYDVIRVRELLAIENGLNEQRHVVLTGPSGSGKSTLLWRAARVRSRAGRVVRVIRLEPSDVETLVRYVRLLTPRESSPVVVACDDLGRPHTAGWGDAVRRLLEIAHVEVLGASRAEDLTPGLMRHGGVLVTVGLEDHDASSIADQLQLTGVELVMEPSEAVSLADGHLLEFIALLTTGQRLRAVLSDQVHGLRSPERAAQLRIARLVCTADVLGASLPATQIASSAGVDGAELPASLDRLRGEHIVVADGDAWSGLHQRRSEEISSLIHEVPPPSLEATVATVVDAVTPNATGWVVERAIEVLGIASEAVADAVAARASRAETADELADLLEFLERADHTLTARAYVPVLERYRRPGLSLRDLSLLVLGNKLGGVEFADIGNPLVDQTFRRLRECADELPDRSTFFCRAACAALAPGSLVALLTDADLAGAVRLLEATERYLSLSDAETRTIGDAFRWPAGLLDVTQRSLQSRLIASLDEMSPAGLPAEVFGAPADRLAALGACHRNVIDATHHGTQATLQLLAGLAEEQGRIRHAWDVTARSDDTSSVNAQAVGLAETTFAACPEFDVVEVITVTPTGERLMQNGFEPGYKRLERARMHRSAQVRVNVGVSAALSRHTAANSWSTLARQRAATALEVADLLAAAPRRLAAHDNPNRRDAWVRRLKAVAEQCAALPSIPQVTAFDPSQNAVQADAAAHDEDSLSKLLGNFVAHLQLLVPEAGGRLVPLGAAEQLNKTSRKLREAMDDGNVLTVAGEAETYEEIDARSRRVAAVLACTDIEPSVARRIKGPPPAFDATVDALIDEVTQRQLEEQRAVLVSRFSQIPGVSIEWAPDEEAFSSALARQRWMVIVDVDDLDSGIAALEDWPDDIWPVAGPSVTLLAAHDGQLVPFAARLTRSLPAPWLPLGTDDVEELAASLSMSVITGSASEAVQAIVQQALETSWRLARAHLRFANWPVPRFNAASVVAELRTRVVAVVSDRPAEDLEQILTALIDDLDAETEGHNPGQLAASVLGPDFAGSPDAMTEPALAAFGIAVLLALDIDVQEAGRG